MERFVRQKPADTNVATNIDFGAGSEQIAHVLDPEVYALRIESARIVSSNENTLFVFDLVEVESNTRVALQPIWVDDPNAGAGRLAAENRYLIAQLLGLAASRPLLFHVSAKSRLGASPTASAQRVSLKVACHSTQDR
jgi:hypothetical protein